MPVWLSKALCWLLVGLVAISQAADAQNPIAKRLRPGDLLIAGYREPGTLKQAPAADSQLQITVVEGEDAINIIKRKTAVAPVVEVRDRNKQPLAGALVTFTSPSDGPSATFAEGAHSVTLTTDAAGRAAVTQMQPEGKGSFEIQVTATFAGATASATINQTNVMTAADAASANGGAAGPVGTTGAAGLSKGVLIAILGGAAAAGIGIIFALHGGKSSTSGTSSTLSATIGVGSGVTVTHP